MYHAYWEREFPQERGEGLSEDVISSRYQQAASSLDTLIKQQAKDSLDRIRERDLIRERKYRRQSLYLPDRFFGITSPDRHLCIIDNALVYDYSHGPNFHPDNYHHGVIGFEVLADTFDDAQMVGDRLAAAYTKQTGLSLPCKSIGSIFPIS